ARFPNPHPLLVVAGQDFGKALGMLLRPQLQQLPLAVIDEVIVRPPPAGDADSENARRNRPARFPNPHPLLVVAGQDFGKALGMLLR
ncbi:hypothetical protein ACUOCP_53540, partial [Escherichia sp. R-CC3]